MIDKQIEGITQYYVLRNKDTGMYFRGKGVNRWGKYFNQATIYRVKGTAEASVREVSWHGEKAEIVPIQIFENEAGYRKASDVAREIFEEIENAIGYDFHSGEELRIVFALSKLDEVKRKHLNEDFFIKMTHTCPHIIPHTIESITDIAFQESEGEG